MKNKKRMCGFSQGSLFLKKKIQPNYRIKGTFHTSRFQKLNWQCIGISTPFKFRMAKNIKYMSLQWSTVRQIMVRLQYEVMAYWARWTEWFIALWKLWCDSPGQIWRKPFSKNLIRFKYLQVVHSESNTTFCGFQQLQHKSRSKLVIKNVCKSVIAQCLHHLLLSNQLLIFVGSCVWMDSTWCIGLSFCSRAGEKLVGCFDPSAV